MSWRGICGWASRMLNAPEPRMACISPTLTRVRISSRIWGRDKPGFRVIGCHMAPTSKVRGSWGIGSDPGDTAHPSAHSGKLVFPHVSCGHSSKLDPSLKNREA